MYMCDVAVYRDVSVHMQEGVCVHWKSVSEGIHVYACKWCACVTVCVNGCACKCMWEWGCAPMCCVYGQECVFVCMQCEV